MRTLRPELSARVANSGHHRPEARGGEDRAHSAPWTASSTTATDCTLHQLAPYIGRIKTSIAAFLIEQYTRPDDLVVDPFCGSGVIPLEAAVRGRRVIASDINPYGIALTRAKLCGPMTEESALKRFDKAWQRAQVREFSEDLRSIPLWVRRFFHPATLRQTLALRDELVAARDWFSLACLLGILHHQRPGFLSYPSSHLVPYLRDRLFPRDSHPALYQERAVYPRMIAKIKRTFRRPPPVRAEGLVRKSDSRRLCLEQPVDAVITSPPYMNELDYVRDNRLRLWFLERSLPPQEDIPKRQREPYFRELMASTLTRLGAAVKPGGVIVLVVGEASRGSRRADSAAIVRSLFRDEGALAIYDLAETIDDCIPDIRRSRRDLRGTRQETILVYRRRKTTPPRQSASLRGEVTS